MARKRKADIVDIVAERKAAKLNQSEYWTRFGVTQSGGSRYESGRGMPKPLTLLIRLHRAGKINDKDLAAAQK